MRYRYVTAALVAAALTAAGCGSSGNGSATKSNSGGAATDGVAQATRAMEANFKGTDRALPTTGPAIVKGKTVWVIAADVRSPGAILPAQGAIAAAKVAGWQTRLGNGKSDPAAMNAQIRTALASRPDGIILSNIDCPLVRQSLTEAHRQGVPVFAIYSLDCDDPAYGGAGQPLFTATPNYGPYHTFAQWLEDGYAPSIADYVVAKTNGKAKVLAMRQDDVGAVKHIADGFARRLHERCPSCSLTDVTMSLADFTGGKFQAKAEAALTRNPQANVLMVPYDGAILLGLGAAAKSSGRDLLVTGGECFGPNLAQIAGGGPENVCGGAAAGWVGYVAIDGLNRIFAGEKTQPDSGIGWETIDRDHPSPSGQGPYDGNRSTDYAAAYQRIWHVNR